MQYLEKNEHDLIEQSFYRNIVVSGAGLVALYSVFFLYFEAYAAAIVCAVTLLVVVPIILYFNRKNKLYASRMLTVIAFSGCTFFLGMAQRNLNHGEYYYLPAMMLSLLLYKPEQKNEIAFSLFLPILCWIGLNILPNPLENSGLLPPSTFPYNAVSMANFIGAAGFVYILLRFYLQSALLSQKVEIENEHRLLIASKLASIGELATGIAHEINNPLSVIVGRSQILKTKLAGIDNSNEDFISCRQNLDKIEETAALITKIVRGLNHFSRDSDEDDKKAHSVQEIIGYALELCEDRIKSKNIELKLNNNIDCNILCREVQITQILINLINNSIDAIENNAERWIEISLYKNTDKIKISVKDSGNGIPTHVAEKMMQPFFSTKQTGKGIGLGLSISKSIAESHDGKLTYDFQSENTKFDLELPIHPRPNGH